MSKPVSVPSTVSSTVPSTVLSTVPSTGSLPPAPPAVKSEINTTENGYRLPEVNTLLHAIKLSIVEDKPILMDYWINSLDKTVLIGVKEDKEKLLVKSEEEYTSPISKIFKVGKEYIIVTENSIYIIDTSIPTKHISS
jgi:hypothetical protein